ncbi:MAG: ATP-dependent RecD-like DNA helicase [Johnsonella sp.]|nr:ATP-dependent RecD-like DNA helicase [Johnsonella sp.]
MISGYIEKIKYRNTENGYSVLSVSAEGEEYILVGNFNDINEGDFIEAEGKLKLHPIYGEQLFVEHYELKQPSDIKSIEKYLSSGAIKGIGEALASRLIKKFHEDTLRVIEEEPERLIQVKGISERLALSISAQVEEKKEQRAAMMFLQKYGIGMSLAMRIYKTYGQEIYGIIASNPYRIAEDIGGIGFKTADEIALKAGIHVDSAYRARGGILYILSQAAGAGHMYLPMESLAQRSANLLGIEEERIKEELGDMQMEGKIVVKPLEEECPVYLSSAYYMELNCAKLLHDLNISSDENRKKIEEEILETEKECGLSLDELQRNAVIEAYCNGLLLLTGGPGTGKTTTIDILIRYFHKKGMEVLLGAPTGRAAKRMTEATGHEAKTIHRLLEINVLPGREGEEELSFMRFERNEENPLEADAVIIDEMSMVDMRLMYALLSAVPVGTRLILVGDTNQLPAVGPGNVLRDMIEAGCFPTVKLSTIYRQARQSDIVVNAHKMIRREKIDLFKESRDFLFIRREGADAIIAAMLTLAAKKIPNYVGADMMQVQVMTPMRKGALGVERLNQILQQHLNPPDADKEEKALDSVIYRVGDKVMQIKNNYQIEWESGNEKGMSTEKGSGIYNGDIGIIREIDSFSEILSVEFDEGRRAKYEFSQLSELEHAYAITVHKSQGSEYPAVIMPLYRASPMLMTRNIIYTAVTRARSCVVLVGEAECFFEMAANTAEIKRYSGLCGQIKGLEGEWEFENG